MKKLKLISKKIVNNNLDVFDIEVADEHHYILDNRIISHNSIGSFMGGSTISGGGGGKYSPSIIFTLTKSQLTDKDSEEHVKKIGLEKARVGIVVTLWPYKQRFARPIPVKIHIPFYKKPNPYVGLEKFVNWETCGIIRGNIINEKNYNKLKPEEQKKCHQFKSKNDEIVYAYPKDTARKLVCKHLKEEVPLAELYTERVFTEDILKQLDENIIKNTFMLPSIESLEDLAEVTDLIDEAKDTNTNSSDEKRNNSIEDLLESE
jgi:hypothetical protein